MADHVPTPSHATCSSPGALRPCIVPQFTGIAMAIPIARATAHGFAVAGFMPVIHWPERIGLCSNRFPRKTKLTAAAALRFAETELHYRQIRAAAKCRQHDLRCSPYPFAIAAE